MPELSRFRGIVISINFLEHEPPHFHARRAEAEVSIGIPELTLLQGNLPRPALALVMKWASLHRDELLNAWERAQRGESPGKIRPLD